MYTYTHAQVLSTDQVAAGFVHLLSSADTQHTKLMYTYTHAQVLSTDQVAAGFVRLLSSADDLVLDCPDVVHLLALFLGRAIVDEVLPPAFLTQVCVCVCLCVCF